MVAVKEAGNVITLNFTVGKDDLRTFSRTFYNHSQTMQSALKRAQWGFPVIMAVMAAYAFFRHGGYAPAVFLVAAALWAVLYPAYFRRHVEKMTDKLLNEGSHEKSLGPCTVTLSEDGLWSRSPTGESKFKLDAVERVLLTDSHLHIVLVGLSGYPIPRRDVDETLIMEAKAFLESKARK